MIRFIASEKPDKETIIIELKKKKADLTDEGRAEFDKLFMELTSSGELRRRVHEAIRASMDASAH